MKCERFRERIALAAGGDLAVSDRSVVERHIQQCDDCSSLYASLCSNRSILSRADERAVTPAALAELRHSVAAKVAKPEKVLGFRIRLERLLLAGLRSPRYATAGIVLLVSASFVLSGQLRSANPEAAAPLVVLEGGDTLSKPEGYKEWVFAGSLLAPEHGESTGSDGSLFHNVYIHPGAYREYARTGTFPEGTVMILESARSESGTHGAYAGGLVTLQASVKDSRFEGGWGYFDFGASTGTSSAKVLPPSAGCLGCHSRHGRKDHVFTQFYPVLGAVWGVL
jgi:hypothetical protein